MTQNQQSFCRPDRILGTKIVHQRSPTLELVPPPCLVIGHGPPGDEPTLGYHFPLLFAESMSQEECGLTSKDTEDPEIAKSHGLSLQLISEFFLEADLNVTSSHVCTCSTWIHFQRLVEVVVPPGIRWASLPEDKLIRRRDQLLSLSLRFVSGPQLVLSCSPTLPSLAPYTF